ncbi:MAG TPA: AMMECR1 family protein, partial [Myxococcota bacterium]|nr:AMMECR1 family protein [Myxococcota bacterium]
DFVLVRTDELGAIEYEISVLFPAVPVSDVNEIVVGRDGLIIQLGSRRGLLLPQVPVEWGWNRQQFLDHTARKAGLPMDAWKNPDAKLFRFEGIIFNEHDVGK